MMQRRNILLWTVLAAIGIFLARPDRLFSSPVPLLDEQARGDLAAAASRSVYALCEEDVNRLLADPMRTLVGAVFTEGTVRNGETLDQILRTAGADPLRAHAFCLALRPYLDLRTMRIGDRYQLWVDRAGEVLQFEYRRGPVEIYRGVREWEDWRISKVEIPVERRETSLAGLLDGSLWDSFLAAGADPDLVMSFVDLFGWDIDFSHESQAGDEFRVIYEKLYADGVPIGNGRILAASYRDSDETHAALFFESDKTRGYFDKNGHSVRKSFLRSPLNFNRISSSFSYRRRHPVTRQVKPHMGVDYAAPTGTPVWAVADATVTHLSSGGASGRMITLRHPMGYESSYLHLSRFAAGVRTGARISQGQVIGFVGSSGLSTGPHLDYRLRKNGVWVNPLRHAYEPGPPVPDDEREAYRQVSAQWIQRLDELDLTIDLAERTL